MKNAFNAVNSEDFTYIDNAAAWRDCLRALAGQPRVALDLEANSLYAYRERICLIQCSIPGRDFIIDPLAGFELEGLGALLADAAVEKVFHASEYDLILLKREHDWDLHNLFDTMWAARVLGYNNMGLAWFLREYYGVEMAKKYQRANWSARPLKPELLDYARTDTHYLLRLRDDLAGKLEAEGRMEEALELFARESEVRVPVRAFDPEGFWKIPGAQKMRGKDLAVLRELYLYRESEAQRRDLPVFKILGNKVLVELAHAKPQSMRALGEIPGVAGRNADRMGNALLRVIRKGRDATPPKRPPRKPRRDPAIADRFDKLFSWRKNEAQTRGVESDVILRRDSLWEIAEANPKSIEELRAIVPLGTHRLEMYGQRILDEIA